MATTMMGHIRIIGNTLGLYGYNGKENGNCYLGFWVLGFGFSDFGFMVFWGLGLSSGFRNSGR